MMPEIGHGFRLCSSPKEMQNSQTPLLLKLLDIYHNDECLRLFSFFLGITCVMATL